MENRIAIIENNIVTNIIIADQEFVNNYNGTAIILNDTPASIGWEYNAITSTFTKNQNEIIEDARIWRNAEIKDTDFIVPLTDYPNRDAILVYRQELRDWPSTDAFPETKPVKP
jgi:hypothetical protein